ncbi:MAG TPA: 2-oxoacid:ferredoxin oxidoreductase subunit beta [Sorangium sp.]|nr:2-oxoacid:ferredoxin oxidoreductase subunit beta [Sorangium sp.]
MGTNVKSNGKSNLKKKDFQSDQDVRWCPGCGDYAILAQVQKVLADLGADRDNTVFVSGIGCSSRFPYYMNTYGMHTIHGRAPAIATGLKTSRPDLDVWVITGDGDALSIGGNHLIHALRRNVNLKILLFNNRIYGLTKGQYSPTSELGKRSPTSPYGSADAPFDPLAVALGAGASFVARSVDTNVKHLQGVLKRAAAHKGSAFIEIYQNCNVFNDLAFIQITGKDVKSDRQLMLENGQPLVFGAAGDKGLRMDDNGQPEVVAVGDGPGQVARNKIPTHDETRASSYAFTLAHLAPPNFPAPMGVLRAVERPTYGELIRQQATTASGLTNDTSLASLWNMGDCWDAS